MNKFLYKNEGSIDEIFLNALILHIVLINLFILFFLKKGNLKVLILENY